MVTIIIPTYKRSDYLGRAIESLLNQTYKNIEIIVVDDNDEESVDRKNNEVLMEKYLNDNRVKYIKHKKNMNGAAARNTGISIAKGEFITFLDDDDFFLNNRIESLVNALNENKEYDCAYTGVIRIENNKVINIFKNIGSGNFKRNILEQNAFFRTGSNMFFRGEILKKLNGFDTKFLRHQDLEVMVRFFRKSKILSVDNYSVVKDDTSRLNVPNQEKAYKMRKLFLETFEEDINDYQDKNNIYLQNYSKLLNSVDKNSDYYELILNDIKKYSTQPPIITKEISIKNGFLKKILKLIRGYCKKNIYLTKEERKSLAFIIKNNKIEKGE